MPELFSEQGYTTGMFSKWHLGDTKGRFPADQGFDANVFLQYRWRDPRLADGGAKKISRPLHEVWHPQFLIINQQKIGCAEHDIKLMD